MKVGEATDPADDLSFGVSSKPAKAVFARYWPRYWPGTTHNQQHAQRRALELAEGRVLPGLFPPPPEMEEHFLSLIRSCGSVPPDMLNWIS